ncbi:MAG: DUF6454 family protein [Alphaproteobacteria bacterium]
MSSVEHGLRADRHPRRGRGFLFRFGGSGELVAQTQLGEGDVFHPGGMAFDGEWLWVPVAEYRPKSSSIIYRIDPRSLRAAEAGRVADHIGGVVRDPKRNRLYGLDWGSEAVYEWQLDSNLRLIDSAIPPRPIDRPEHIRSIEYQDCHHVAGSHFLCGGVSADPVRWGGLDLVHVDTSTAVHQVTVPMRTPEQGRHMTHNPVFIESKEDGLRFYFAPDDDETTVYIYDVHNTGA